MGTCILPQNLSKRLIKELIQGKEMATKLQLMLHDHNKPLVEENIGFGSVSSSSSSAEELASKILNSFSQTLSVVTGYNNDNTINNIIHSNSSDQTSQVNPHDQASHCDDPSSDDYGAESKIKRSSHGIKDRRGCYKRSRKNSQSWTTTVSTLEDGQAWRKYGQKEILNAEYPRAYFRCTRKYDQGCRATRQVQQIQDNPKLYQTTYIGEHTCKNILKPPQMIIKDSDLDNNLMNVITSTTILEEVKPIISSSITTNDTSSLSDDHHNKLSLDHHHHHHNNSDHEIINLWPSELKDLELSDPSMGLLSSSLGVSASNNDDHDIVSIMFSFGDRTINTTNCSTSGTNSHSLDMDEFVDTSIEFRSCDFEFDDNNEFCLLGSL
ncbi:WRKY DNA-binding transcription factor 70 isoform X1 [Cannabis sativa]|uniref:WRKY DNA-binding transcription factor 70 isoform X1 n=1 Tax=Cannabis sativa TaxID=3483 RepID=UPI0029CA8B10|nr:WRKY DNA-binding transcription factor 70 isoform X1 [Cannabis sativa]